MHFHGSYMDDIQNRDRKSFYLSQAWSSFFISHGLFCCDDIPLAKWTLSRRSPCRKPAVRGDTVFHHDITRDFTPSYVNAIIKNVYHCFRNSGSLAGFTRSCGNDSIENARRAQSQLLLEMRYLSISFAAIAYA